jgi:23S rRNA (adenine2030-N6)-methyltransferase
MELLLALQAKEKGFCYIDTHAGIADYDLTSSLARKTEESKQGIVPLFKLEAVPECLKPYLNLLKTFNKERAEKDFKLDFYPGSPRIAQLLSRPQDRLIFNELHLEDCKTLKKALSRDKRVTVHQRDGYEFLNAILPPIEKRGLILIDPAYEKTDELTQLLLALNKAMKRFSTGVYAIWLPIKEKHYRDFYRQLKQEVVAEILIAEIVLKELPLISEGLVGSSMIIINPPYQIEKTLREQVKALWELWSPEKEGYYSILKSEGNKETIASEFT